MGLLTSGRHTAVAYRSVIIAGPFGSESREWSKLFTLLGCSLMTASAHEMAEWARRGITINENLYTNNANANQLKQGDRLTVDGVNYNVVNSNDMGDRGRAFKVILYRPESD